MRLLIIGDLHGQVPTIPDVEYDMILQPGDVCGDEGVREYVMQGLDEFLDGEDEPRDWWEIAGREEAKSLLDDAVAQGREVMEHLDAQGVPVFVIPGNWDYLGVPDADWEPITTDHFHERVLDGLENVLDFDECVVELGDLSLIGYGEVQGPELPSLRGYDVSEEEEEQMEGEYAELKAFYDELFAAADNPVVLVSHNAPYETSLDIIDNEESPRDGWHYGSLLARELTEQHQPVLTVGAHIHEGFGLDAIGDTPCVNVGFGPEKHALAVFEDGALKELSLYDGARLVEKEEY